MRKRSAYKPKYPRNDWVATRTLATQPWRIAASLDPVEKILDQIERTGCVDSAKGEVIFKDAGSAHYYSAVPALRGITEMFELAAKRKAWPLDITALNRLATKLDVACPLVQSDIKAARTALAAIRHYAPTLTLGEADDLVNTVRISQEMERIGASA
jgi:hypothetical protein